MAERFNQNINLQPVSNSTGAASGIMSLVERLEQFKNFAYQKAVQIGTEQAVSRGISEAGQVQLEKEGGLTKAPQFKEKRFVGGVEIDAYNKALRGAYLASLNRDIRLGISEIQDKNFENLTGFNTEIESFKNATIKNIDPIARQEALSLFEDVVNSARLTVQSATIKKDKENAKFQLENSSSLILDDALTYANNGDFYSAAKGLLDYNNSLLAQRDAGFLTESQVIEKSRQAQLHLTHENMVGDIRKKTQDQEFKSAINTILSVRDNIPGGMSPDEHQKLVSEMIETYSQGLGLFDKIEEDDHKQVKLKQNVNYGELAIGITQGITTLDDIVRVYRKKQITDSQFDKLVGTLNTRGQGIDDHLLINEISDAMSDYENIKQPGAVEFIESVIMANTGTSLTDKTSGELMTRLADYRSPDFILNRPEVKRAKSFITPSMRIVGLAGAFDSEAERRLADAIRTFDDRVMSGEDPWAVADELIGKDQIARRPKPMYGSKSDLKTAREQLNEAAKRGEIDKATYNYQDGLIRELEQFIETQKNFDEARRNANANTVR